MSNLVALGYVAKAFGLRGGVTIKLFSEASEALREGLSLTLRQGLKEQILNIKEVLPEGRVFFEGLSDRNEAEALRGAEVFIERGLLPELPDDEFYLGDLLGAHVVLESGERVGEIIGFSSNSAQTLVEVKTIKGHVASIPLVPAIVKDIDGEKMQMVIDPPEGLLDE